MLREAGAISRKKMSTDLPLDFWIFLQMVELSSASVKRGIEFHCGHKKEFSLTLILVCVEPECQVRVAL